MTREVKLKEIWIRNYRSCIDTKLESHPKLSCLIGYNGSGKTSILSGICLLRSIFSSSGNIFREEGPSGTCRLQAEFAYGARSVLLRLDLLYTTSEGGTDDVVNYRATWNLGGLTRRNEWLNIPIPALFDQPLYEGGLVQRRPAEVVQRLRWIAGTKTKISTPMLQALFAVCDYIQRITYYGASQFTNPARCPTSFQVEEKKQGRVTTRMGHHAKFIADLYFAYTRRQHTPDYLQFLDFIGPRGLHLVDRIQFPSYALPERKLKVVTGGRVIKQIVRRRLVVPNISLNGARLSPSQLSEGTFKTLALVFYLVSDRSRLLLLEEPEVCVHHGLLNSVVELIKRYSREKQIIFSTHSDFVLDAVAPESVFLVSRTSKRGTKVRAVPEALSAGDFRVLRKYLSETGNLGEFWRHGGFA